MENNKTLIDIEPYRTIYEFLSYGSKHGLSKSELCLRTGLGDRELRKAVEKLRTSGTVICSDVNGYFLPENKHELAAYIHQESARASTNLRKIKAAQELYVQWATKDGE